MSTAKKIFMAAKNESKQSPSLRKKNIFNNSLKSNFKWDFFKDAPLKN